MKINGKEVKLENQTVLSGILENQGFNLLKIAVMKNGDIVPKAEYDKTLINDNDSLEVVSFVGGG
ncbi:MAG: sulfur carrier protein ThiS [Oscillospiraceae bacterium]|nr:sulfur carrier protein ThiS [Oscillospiraceae bacterium]